MTETFIYKGKEIIHKDFVKVMIWCRTSWA
jgi:hypothetical protein